MARRRRIPPYVGGSIYIPYASAGGNYARTALDPSLSPGSSSLTIAWNTSFGSGAGASLLKLYNATYADGLLVYYKNTRQIQVRTPGGNITAAPIGVAWGDIAQHRLAVTLDAATNITTLYLDGVQILQSSALAWSAFAASCRLCFGDDIAEFAPMGVRFSDVVVDVGHAWTAAQVAADYFDAIQPSMYTHRWPCDDGAGTTARATRGGLSLTLGGSAAWSADAACLPRGVVRNFVAQSGRVDTSPWTSLSMSLALYGGSLPTGVDAMVTCTSSGAAGFHNVSQTPVMPPVGTKIIVSGYASKAAGAGWILVQDGVATNVYFNVGSGVPNAFSGALVEPTNVAGIYRWSFPMTVASGSKINVLLADADGTPTSGTSTNSIVLGGIQIEIAAPGQTTPSPYVATQAAPLSVYGKRETRQNLLRQSDKPSDTMYWGLQGAVLTSGKTDPLGGTKAYLVDYTAVAANQGIYQFNAGMGGAQNTKGVWLRGVVGGEQIRLLDSGFTGTTLVVTLTTSWTYYQITDAAGAQPNNAGLWLQKVSGSQFYMAFPRHCIGPDASEYIATTTAPANANGAPRSRSL